MSNRALDAVLNRLYRDAGFRQRLREDAEQALAEYDLTPKEKAALSRLQRSATRQQPLCLNRPPRGYSFSLN